MSNPSNREAANNESPEVRKPELLLQHESLRAEWGTLFQELTTLQAEEDAIIAASSPEQSMNFTRLEAIHQRLDGVLDRMKEIITGQFTIETEIAGFEKTK